MSGWLLQGGGGWTDSFAADDDGRLGWDAEKCLRNRFLQEGAVRGNCLPQKWKQKSTKG